VGQPVTQPHGNIACLTLQPGAKAGLYEALVGGERVVWELIPVVADIEGLRGRMTELLQEYDAVAIDGVSSSFRIGEHDYKHEAIWHALDLPAAGARFSDGSGLRATLERYLTRLAAEQLEPELRGASVLIFSGLTRYGVADVLSNYSKRLVFGDLLYGFRLGIPIDGLKSFVQSAPNLVRAVGSTPASWYWPSARRTKRVMPRFQFFFRRAKVIVGDFAYFERYAPPRLDGKIIFTNLNSDGEIDYFRQAGVKALVSLTPVLDGVRVPLPVLEAFLSRRGQNRQEAHLEDHLINEIHALGLRPEVISFGPTDEAQHALVELPLKQPPLSPVEDAEALPVQPAADVGRFAFVIHPLNFHQIKRLKVVQALSTFLPERLLEDAAAQAPPFLCGKLKNVTSATGAKAEGLIYAVPMTSRAIMRFPAEFLYKKLLWIAEDAAKRGCRVMGLGAYTSVVGDAGVTVSQHSPIGVTSGNSYTVAATLLTLETAAERCGLKLGESAALVIGATGSIGSICARLLAKRVERLYLVSPRPERLLALSDQIEDEVPALKGKIQLSRTAGDFLGLAQVVVTTTSAVDPVVDVTALQPGCVVCDVARPPDIKPEAAAKRDDILVVDSGEIRLPEGAELTVDVGLPPGTIYACLAETLLLGLEQRPGHYTLGRAIDPRRVEEITTIGKKHGFQLAELRSFGKPVPEERFERLRQINGSRQRGPRAVPAGGA
jgi:predicted amino acid dehydrogenase